MIDITMYDPNDPTMSNLNANWFSSYIDHSLLSDLDIFWYRNSEIEYSKEFLAYVESYKEFDPTMYDPIDPVNAEWFSAYIDYSVLDDLDKFCYNNSEMEYSKEFIDYVKAYKWEDYEEFEKYIDSYKEFDR